jgi:quinol monooxygenase YgiN
MSLPVLVGFAGVLVAAVATGLLAGRSVRQPRIHLILWTAATLALTAALAAQSMGFDRGFSAATFRASSLAALLLAPLGLGWGLIELVAGSEAVRFGTRLISAALIVVAAVILVTDPLTAQPAGTSWPSAGAHFQPVALYALDVVQVAAVLAAVASGLLAVLSARRDSRWWSALPGVAAVGLAVLMTAGMRAAWPDRSVYPLLGLLAAALVWFGAVRTQPVSGRSQPAAGDGVAGPAGRDLSLIHGEETGNVPGSYSAAFGGSQVVARAEADADYPAFPAPEQAAGSAAPQPQIASAGASARPYGRILIFTLLDDRVTEFDRLAEQAAEEVRIGEPGTLVYVIHLVPNAPLQRIFYEIYRDRAAFDSHESQPYMKRFVADRRSCVLATNVIELRLKYAKVAPLPGPPSPASEPVPPPPRGPARTPAGRPPASSPYRGA